MLIDKYYHAGTGFAFVVLPGIEDPDTLAMELGLLQLSLKIQLPMVFELRKVAEGRHWGCSILKFKLLPGTASVLGFKDISSDAAKDLKVEPYQYQV